MLSKKSPRQTKNIIAIVSAACLLSVAFFAGCKGDSNLADVTGVVTLDGNPLPDAFVTFLPVSGGSSSSAKTDSKGAYRMMFTNTKFGAFIGESSVKINTGDVKPDNSGRIPELVPKVYNTETKLLETVVAGRNTFNFELNSKASKVDAVKLAD